MWVLWLIKGSMANYLYLCFCIECFMDVSLYFLIIPTSFFYRVIIDALTGESLPTYGMHLMFLIITWRFYVLFNWSCSINVFWFGFDWCFFAVMPVRRCTDPTWVQQIWDAIRWTLHQKQQTELNRLTNYLKGKGDHLPEVSENQIKQAQKDKLLM